MDGEKVNNKNLSKNVEMSVIVKNITYEEVQTACAFKLPSKEEIKLYIANVLLPLPEGLSFTREEDIKKYVEEEFRKVRTLFFAKIAFTLF